MEKPTVIFIFLLCLFVPLASCVQTYEINQPLDIRHTITVNGIPTVTATCNITVANPDYKVLVNYKPMTVDTSAMQYNYTVQRQNISIIGDYCYTISCFDSGNNKTSSYCKTITPAGDEISTGQSIVYLFILVILGVLFVLSVYGAIVINSKNGRNQEGELVSINNFKYFKIFLWALSYIILISVVYLSWNLSYAYLYIPLVATFFGYIWTILLMGLLPFICLCFVFAFVRFYQDHKLEKMLERGITIK